LPPLARIGELYRRDRAAGIAMAEQHAIVMASEVRACDIDISFAPVVDLARGNRVIADRAFDADPQAVAELGAAYVRGMRLAGMAATIKHFPGHGSIPEDTHLEAAADPGHRRRCLSRAGSAVGGGRGRIGVRASPGP